VTALLLIVSGSLGVLFLWGLLAPRSQWRVLVSWSYRDPHADEPTGSAYLLYRIVAAFGIATMVVSGVLAYRSVRDAEPVPPPPPTAAERMWGSPAPVVVNRVVHTITKPPKDLVSQPILGYQPVSGTTRQPLYLFSLPTFELADATTENGYIGSDPSPGLVALDTADLVVRVEGDPACFPHKAIVRESEDTVAIAIYYGRATPPADAKSGDAADDEVAPCNTRASGLNVSTLIPISLASPLGNRTVVTLEGDAIRSVAVLQ
jgi:hypothetical protein